MNEPFQQAAGILCRRQGFGRRDAYRLLDAMTTEEVELVANLREEDALAPILDAVADRCAGQCCAALEASNDEPPPLLAADSALDMGEP